MGAVLFAILLLQDPAIDAHVKALSNEDIAVREKATAELLKTPLAKLNLLESHLKGPDAESCARVRKIMTQVLASHLGSRKTRFELRAIADEKIVADWIAAGADPKKAPEGYEARRFHVKIAKDEDQEWTLVAPACITGNDLKDAQAEPEMERGPGRWLIRFELKASSAKKFDEIAAQLFERTPKGRLGIVLDERILMAPTVQAPRFHGQGVIAGNFSEDEAKDAARALKGDWLESSMRAEREGKDAALPEKVMDHVQGMKGLGKVAMTPDAAGVDIAGFVDIREVDLLALWQALRDRGYRLAPKK